LIREFGPRQQRRGSHLAKWTLIISISFVVLSLSKLEPLARSSVQNHHDSKFDLPQTPQSNHSVVVDTQHFQSSEVLSSVARGAMTRCTFCEGEGDIIPSLDFVVPNTGGNTCASIK